MAQGRFKGDIMIGLLCFALVWFTIMSIALGQFPWNWDYDETEDTFDGGAGSQFPF